MLIYAGIDEAGYGPMFGPLTIGRVVMAIEHAEPGRRPPDLWHELRMAVCRRVSQRRGRVAVNDSKKIYSRSSGLNRLEEGVLSFAALCGHDPSDIDEWLDALGETAHHDLSDLPWYAPSEQQPWESLPCACTDGELAVARGMLRTAAKAARVGVVDIAAAVVFEDRFNRMVKATRSKAAASFTFVAGHLNAIWNRFGRDAPVVVVDRQSGRTRYRELLQQTFPDVSLVVEDETAARSAYRLETDKRRMTIQFETEAEQAHMPVALASMISKYTRELLMARFQSWFHRRAPQVKPTAGYASDAKRFWEEIQPHLSEWAIEPERLRRRT